MKFMKFLTVVLFPIFRIFYNDKYWTEQAKFSPYTKRDLFVSDCIGYVILCFSILTFCVGVFYISKDATDCTYYPSHPSCPDFSRVKVIEDYE